MAVPRRPAGHGRQGPAHGCAGIARSSIIANAEDEIADALEAHGTLDRDLFGDAIGEE
jgi:hypothetical protein